MNFNYNKINSEQGFTLASIVNKTCLVLSSLLAIVYYFYDILELNITFITIFIYFLINEIFIKKSNAFYFKLVLIAGMVISNTILSILGNEESLMHLIFLPFIIYPIIIFSKNERNTTYFFVIISSILFFLFQTKSLNNYFNWLTIEESEHIRHMAQPILYILLILPVWKLYSTQQDLTEKLISANTKASTEASYYLEQNELVENIINSSDSNSILALDENFKIIKFNIAFKNNSFRTNDAYPTIGMNYFDLIPKSKQLLYKPLLKKALSGKSFSKKIIKKLDGKDIHSELLLSPLKINNKIKGICIFTKDISDSINLEYAVQEKRVAVKSLQFRTDFLAQMSHEIRTPLNGIVGMTNLIQDSDNLNDVEKEQLKIITESGNDLMHIINSVLDLSKLEAGQVKLSSSIRKTNRLLDHSKNLFKEKANLKGLKLEVIYGNSIPEGVEIDAVRIHQILNNLVSNAIKFTEKGIITIKLEAVLNSDNTANLKFEVVDTGAGLNKIDQNKLFNKYEQLNSNLIRKSDGSNMGTGLGLTIAQELVQLMNGSIGVESEKGKGSTFYFEIPNLKVEKVDDGNNQIKDDSVFNGLGKHILVVEDKKVNQIVAQMVLKSIGCTSEIAENGEVCLMKYKDNQDKFDLILMDIQMPVMDGITATGELRRNFKDLPPIIALSANNMEGDSKYYSKHGLDGYIAKPINGTILKEELSTYF